MNVRRTAISGRSLTLSIGEVLALAIRSGQAIPVIRGVERGVAAQRSHAATTAMPIAELQGALDHFRTQARLTASEDFHAFLNSLGTSLDDTLEVFRLGFYGGLAGLTTLVGAPEDFEHAVRLLPITSFVEGHWTGFSERAAMMVAAYEATEPRTANASLASDLGNSELRAAAPLLGLTPERLELVGRICVAFQKLSAQAAAAPEFDTELATMVMNLTEVLTWEAHAETEGVGRELYCCLKDGKALLDLCRDLRVAHEQCLHRVAALRKRAGWEPLAFGQVGEAFFLGSWEGAHVVAHVQDRRAPSRDDERVRRRVAEQLVSTSLVRERELVRIAMV